MYPKGELIIWNDINNTVFKLAFKFDIYAVEPLSREYVFIDAQTGELLEKEPILKNATATGTLTTRYSGVKTSITEMTNNASYRLSDLSRGNGINTLDMNRGVNFSSALHFIDNNNVWTATEWHNGNEDDAALEAHWALQQTYDYFKTIHNRNSYDNNGAAINCYVHYDFRMDNGYWDGSRIVLGDGDIDFDNVCSVDVLAHEFGHAICQSTCDLRYQGESGAINEGLSDIWGICVENYAAPEKQMWRIAEDITLTAVALRATDNPNLLTYLPELIGSPTVYPDTYQGTGWYTGIWDDGGVHINNTVLSHWFYLLVNGGRGTNDNGDFYFFDGINITSAAKIVYRMETIYLNSSSDFADARVFAVQAAKDLYGTNSTATYAVESAWYAVGVGSPANQINNYIVGPTQLTPGYSATYSVTQNVNATSYVWIIPSGCYANYFWTARIGQGTPQLNVMAGAVGSGTITCRIYQGSVLIDSKSLDVNVQNPYSGGGSGDTDPCNDGGDDDILKIINGVIYPPEPCDETDYLVFEQKSFVSIEVFNLMGQKIFKSANANEFDTSCLTSGVFIIKALTNDGNSYSKKIIRN